MPDEKITVCRMTQGSTVFITTRCDLWTVLSRLGAASVVFETMDKKDYDSTFASMASHKLFKDVQFSQASGDQEKSDA